MKSEPGQVVVLTGASTGIGRATALALADAGYHVLAGVRRPKDAPVAAQVQEVLLDVTRDDEITAVADRVRQLGRPLAAVINNAAMLTIGPVEVQPIDQWRKHYEVNLFGAVRLTQVLLPALRRSRGTVVNISSIGGRMATPMLAAYQSTKFAMEAFSDALRMETRDLGVRVVVIEPGGVKTPIFAKSRRLSASNEPLSHEQQAIYGYMMDAFDATSAKAERQALPPERVASVIVHAVRARNPKTRYLVGPDAQLLAQLKARLPDRWFDAFVLKVFGFPAARKASTAVSATPVAAG